MAMRLEKNLCNRIRGFTLVELLVAITIGAIILAGAVTLFVNNRDTYKTTNELSRLQETARYALGMMVKDIRMAGYFGCADRLDTINDRVNAATAGALWDPASNSIEGLDAANEAAGQNTYLPSGYQVFVQAVTASPGLGDTGRVVSGSDAFAVRYIAGSLADTDLSGTPDYQILGAPAAPAPTSTAVTADNLANFNPISSPIAAVSDCGSSNVFEVAGIAGNQVQVKTTAPREAISVYNVTATNRPSVVPYIGVRYYVGLNSRDEPSLYRSVIRFTGDVAGNALEEREQELFEGVESLQLLYGEDTDADGTPDSYATATGVGNWTNVVSVRLSILVRTIDEHGRDADTNTYPVNDIVFDPNPNDRRRRRVFTTTIMVRNL
jgi:type IV pilus assembly protein PilW